MIHEILKKRYSPRTFSGRKIGKEKVESLLEAARWAPSSMNEQPWRFIIACRDDVENFDKLLSTLKPNNQIWAQNAPVLILAIAKQVSEFSRDFNNHALYDLGNSVAQLTFQATAMDLYVRQMGGFYPDKARALFSIPDNYMPVSVLAVGYKGDIAVLPENLKLKEQTARVRKNIEEIAFDGKFGVPFRTSEDPVQVLK